jgi:hypothetical protein
MVEETLEALLQIRGNGIRPGLEDWHHITEILVDVERKLIGMVRRSLLSNGLERRPRS